jgi:Domain of unknown function (DUF1330)
MSGARGFYWKQPTRAITGSYCEGGVLKSRQTVRAQPVDATPSNRLVIRAIHGRAEVLEGSAAEDVVILEFPACEDVKAWYHGSAYQAASQHRHRGGDYRFILTEGISAH